MTQPGLGSPSVPKNSPDPGLNGRIDREPKATEFMLVIATLEVGPTVFDENDKWTTCETLIVIPVSELVG